MSKIIVIDSREQKPYSFYGREVVVKKLDTGDYSIKGFEDTFAIERKSLNDYLRSITHERDRFKREIERGSSMERFEVVIEASEAEVRAGDYYPDVAPLAAINTASAWSNRHGVGFTWANDRMGAKAKTLSLLDEWYTEFCE